MISDVGAFVMAIVFGLNTVNVLDTENPLLRIVE